MRYEDWPERLHRLVSDSASRPFVWGEHDCCLFAANAVDLLTGIDHASDLRGAYSTAAQATKILKKRGGVRGIAGAALGEEIRPTLAQRGDIVLIRTEDHGDTLAVCLGVVCAAPGPDGMVTVPMGEAVTAWRVC